MVLTSEENKFNLERAQEKIHSISIEDLAENLCNASMGNHYWRGKKRTKNLSDSPYPFYINHRGTHADFKVIVPNVHEVYNISDRIVKEKLIDAGSWIIDHFGEGIQGAWDYEEKKQTKEKINILHINKILSSFSGNESYPLDRHDIEGKGYFIKEDSSEFREYIKSKFGKSLLNKLNSENNKNLWYGMISPLEFLPLEFWEEGIQKGFGPEIITNSLYADSFFDEEKYSFEINKIISLGLTPEQMEVFFTKDLFGFHKEIAEKYATLFSEIEDTKMKSLFLEKLDKKITEREIYVREGNKVEYRK